MLSHAEVWRGQKVLGQFLLGPIKSLAKVKGGGGTHADTQTQTHHRNR